MDNTPNQGRFAVLPIRNTVIFPHVALPLRVGRPASRAAVEHAITRGDHWIFTLSQVAEKEEARPDDLYRVGTLCKIEKVRGTANEGYQLLVRGVARFKVLEFEEMQEGAKTWLEAQAEPWL